MMIKVAFATVAAAALCAPAMAPATAAAPSVGNVAYSVPASFGGSAVLDKKKKCKSGGLVNVSCNTVQVPVQACNNNILNNIGIGILGHGSAKGGNSKGKCSQKTKSK